MTAATISNSTLNFMVMPASVFILDTSYARSSITKHEDIIVLSGFGLAGGEPGQQGRYTKTNQQVKAYFLLEV